MKAFDGVVQLWGALTPRIEAQAAKDVSKRVDELLAGAIEAWGVDRWKRFDDLEINCTVQLFKHIEDLCITERKFRIITAQLEWSRLTFAMLDARESAVSMKRPDLRLQIGQAGINVECKRLTLSGGLPAKYVSEGILRFVSGSYAASEPDGAMVGYVQAGDPKDVVAAINAVVSKRAGMGATHCLVTRVANGSYLSAASEHSRPGQVAVSLNHYLPNLQT